MSAEATSTAKAELRRLVRARRRERLGQGSEESRTADAAVAAEAVLDGIRRHRGAGVCRIAAYEAGPTEPPTATLLTRLVTEGYEVVVPVTLPDRDLDWRHAALSMPDVLGAEPLGVDAIRSAEVVLVPALAVDRSGHRLGQGGGSYDRALPRRAPAAIVVALLHDGELLDAGTVPVDPHDVPVTAVVIPGLGWVSLRPEA